MFWFKDENTRSFGWEFHREKSLRNVLYKHGYRIFNIPFKGL